MLESTLELISLAASNSHMVFCLFNLIIALLVVGSTKSNDHNRKLISSVVNDKNADQDSVSSLKTVTSTPVETGEMSTDSEDVCQGEGDEDDGNDDLKRRVEEFIQKMNMGWKEEKMKTYSLDQ